MVISHPDSDTDVACGSTASGQMRRPMRPATPSTTSSRALLAAQGWCAPEVVEALDEAPVERAPLLGRLRELGVGEDRLAQLDDLLRLQERLPGLELTRLLIDAPSPAPRWFLGRLRGAVGAG